MGVRGAEPPVATEIIKNLVGKSMETYKILKTFITYAYFYLKS